MKQTKRVLVRLICAAAGAWLGCRFWVPPRPGVIKDSGAMVVLAVFAIATILSALLDDVMSLVSFRVTVTK